MAAALSGTFANTGASAEFLTDVGQGEAELGLSFVGTGSVNLEKKLGASWFVVETLTGNTVRMVAVPQARSSVFRLNCTARSADIAYYLG